MRPSTRFPFLALIVTVALVTLWACSRRDYKQIGEVSTFERVTKSKELRVGYLVEPPYLLKSTASGQISGIFADVGQELANRLGLKLVWVEEVGIGSIAEAIRQHRFDLIMLPLWRSAQRAKEVGFSIPLFYSNVGIYVRANDSRFDRNRQLLNSGNITVAAIDGELAGEIARADFPLTKVSSLPQLTDYSQLMMEVATKKADVTFFSRVSAARFMKRNPGLIKDVTGERPVRVYAECLIMPIDDFAFRSMIDAALAEMIENGVIDRAFLKNGEDPTEYYRPAIPYRNPVLGR